MVRSKVKGWTLDRWPFQVRRGPGHAPERVARLAIEAIHAARVSYARPLSLFGAVRLICAMGLATPALGCAGAGNFVWVSDLPVAVAASAAEGDYLIREGDVVSLKVLGQEPFSTKARVRSDGRIAFPAIGDVDVRGKRPSAVKTDVEARLKDYVVQANVTVTVEEFQPITVSVLGEVLRPGTYPLDVHASLGQVLASAGGLNDFASRDSIFVVRSAPQPLRVRFTYEDVSRGDPRTAAFALRQGDLIVIE